METKVQESRKQKDVMEEVEELVPFEKKTKVKKQKVELKEQETQYEEVIIAYKNEANPIQPITLQAENLDIIEIN